MGRRRHASQRLPAAGLGLALLPILDGPALPLEERPDLVEDLRQPPRPLVLVVLIMSSSLVRPPLLVSDLGQDLDRRRVARVVVVFLQSRRLAVSRPGPIVLGEKGEAAPTTGRRPRPAVPRNWTTSASEASTGMFETRIVQLQFSRYPSTVRAPPAW